MADLALPALSYHPSMYRKISLDLKECALDLWHAGWSLADIRYALRVSPASMYRWDELRDVFGQAENPNPLLRGWERIVSLAVLDAIRTVYHHEASVMLDELRWYLAIHHDVAISISALQATLERAGLTRKRLQKLAAERDEARRAEYRACIRNLNLFSGTGEEFVAVDESSKDNCTLSRIYGRSPIGTPAVSYEPFVRDTRYTLTAAITIEGYIAARVVEGSMNGYGFFDFIAEEVLPQMRPYPEPWSVLVLDNCRIHHNDLLMDVLNDAGA
uniref:Tc1-like transposase DDE domain-containing protein n=1 Tax=Mycena chlorophos TaxID=658473 RepID=A0ABQ0L2V3_MYCCL|nr:predicted protein [Mycena chlorophos]